MASPDQITITQLARLIGTPDCPVLIDVRTDPDFDEDPLMIPGAFRHPWTDVETLVPELAGKRVVVICQKGKKLSAGSAAVLRTHGVIAENLACGTLGWASDGQPTVDPAPISARRRTLWVTRHRPKIDRIACPWLIRRFIDPAARFLFVAPADVAEVADKFSALPFDVENCHFTHRGDGCTFDSLLADFSLKTPPLDHLARIIRAADTGRLADVPEAAGLLAASLGLSRQFRDDLVQLEAGMALYDAFYRWTRDAQSESHTWDPS